MGSYYVPNPNQYTQVAAYSVARDSTIPSNASIVHGIYFMWNNQGFTGNGWKYEISGGPTNMYGEFNSNDDVADYVAKGNNLNDVFEHWSTVFDSEGWLAFSNAVGASCMDVVQSQT